MSVCMRKRTLSTLFALTLASAHAQLQTAGPVFVNIDATTRGLGDVPWVTNSGTLGGVLEARGGAAAIPRIAIAGSSATRGIQFDGGDYMQHVTAPAGTLVQPPAGLVGANPTRSIEVWALNPTIESEETMVAWGRRGGPDGSNMAFNYGFQNQFGAVGHWGSTGPDLGWNDAGGAPPANVWHHLVYTYDGQSTRVYSDGVLQNSELLGAGVINTHTHPIGLATQLEADGVTPTPTLRGSLTLARVRIHDGVLTPAQIVNNYEFEKATFQDPLAVPLTAAPVQRYSFSEAAAGDASGLTFSDSVGSAHGTVRGSGASFTGTRLSLTGGASTTAAYGDLPNALLSAKSADNGGSGAVTIEGWIRVTGNRTSARVFDFGSTTGGELTAPGGGGNALDSFTLFGQLGGITSTRRVEVRNNDGASGGANTLDYSTTNLTNDLHFAVTWHEGSGEIFVYENGRPVVAMVTDERISSINDVNNWLGRANTATDQNAQMEYDEIRIYNYALSANEVRGTFDLGPNVVNVAGPAGIHTQPQPQTVVEADSATFTVGASGTPPFTYQWRRNGTPIPGATNASYTLATAPLSENGATFSVVVGNVIAGTPHSITSDNALLTVLADTNGPTLVSATGLSLSSIFVIDAVQVEFNEPVSASTATNPANYSLSGPEGNVGISAATLDANERTVLLTTATPLTQAATYTLRVSNVRDRSTAANVIAPNSPIDFVAGFTLRVVGSITASNSVVAVEGGFDVQGAGRDIGGTSDSFAFVSQFRTGDFDLQVRVDALGLSDGYSEAGLMARQGESTNGPFAAVLASGGLGGVKFQSRATPGQAAVSAGSLPVNYPHTWLRLRRVGNTFTGYGGFDGQTWKALGTATINMPVQIYVGFAVSSHNPANTVAAQFRDTDVVSGGTIVNHLALPFEPLGPTSRRTGLAISEIMYHPPEVPGFSLEYIEIFNGQDYYEDLSGFRLDGDIHYTFPPGTTLQSGGLLVIARDPASVEAYYDISGVLGPFRMETNIVGTVTNITPENLPNSTGTVRLENELGAHLLEVNYESEGDWPAAADGAGHSLVLARASYGENDVRAWAASEFVGGSPGRRESYAADPLRAIVINEFLAHTDDPQVDFIELFNTSTQPVDIGDCWLSDDFNLLKFPIPLGTILPPRSWIAFDQNQLGFNLSSDGDEILLFNPDATRVLDIVRFEGQANGVSRGRSPNGAPGFVELGAPTPDANNAAPLARDIVINEIMYHPISGDDNDEYVELYNRGSSPVNVVEWRLVDGINFVIPLNTVIQPGGYLVIAENRTNLLARHPGLNPNLVVGDYGGQLANGGERVALGMPDYGLGTNVLFYIVVDEVTYGDGGRWGQWSDGGGSSLELIDPDADNRLAANWADSDETAKASWTTIERTALIDLGMGGGNGTPNRCEFFIEGPGECLVDDVEVLNNGGANRVTNPGFESGATGWTVQGTQAKSSVQTGGAFAGAQCLRLRAVERGDPGPNKVWTAIAALTTGTTNQATLRARVRWLRGDPNFLIRTRGQWLECGGRMSLPTNLGTPGAANSRRVSNAGPAIYDVTHTPPLPAANEPVIVTARINDPDGVNALTLRYRVDPNTALNDVAMRDDGTGGDAIAGDGIYSGTLPGRLAETLVAFHLRAQDGGSAETLFPNDTPTRECLVRFGETLRPGSIATYRLWLTDANIAYWTGRERNSNEGLDATFVYGNQRVIYNAQTLYSGSPWHTANGPYNGPLNNTCDYEVNFPPDDHFMGNTDFVLNGQNPVYSGTFHQDVSAQAETTAYWFGRKLGLGINHKRHVFVVMNGRFRGMIYFDHQQPNRDIIDEYFPSDPDGRLHKIEDWFEFDDAGNGFSIITCTLENFVVGGQKRSERYRWTWRPRAGAQPNDFADLFALVDASNALGPEPYTSATLGLVDMRNWMRVFALQQMIGNWDSYGYERGKNMYAYKPTQSPWQLVLWDLDLVLGKDSHAPGNALFDMNIPPADPVVMRMYQHPPFVREYWRAMHELVNIWMNPNVYSPLVDARYAAFQANEVPVDSPDAGQSAGANNGMRGWIAARRTFIQGQIPSANFTVTGTNFIQTANNYITLSGTAPVTAAEILVNGGAYPITWTTVTGWTLRVPMAPGTNTLEITAVDGSGNSLSNRTVTVNYTGPTPDPEGSVVINEIMFDPLVDQTSFVELFNTQTSYAFDVSGWRVNGIDYTFPAGSVFPGRSFIVLARNRGEFAKLYGGLRPVFDQFDGALQNGGETLSLFRPGSQPGQEIVVDKVKYEARSPWPSAASGQGASLQLIDPTEDNARVSNWSDGKGWRFFSLTGIPNSTRLLMFLNPAGNLYIDDMALVAGTVPAVGSNYIVNGDFESPLLPAWRFQGNNGTNTTVSADARFTGNQGLDLRFTASGGAIQYVYQDTTNIVSNAVHTLSFWYLPSTNVGNFEIRMSGGYRATINARAPSETLIASPGTNNNISVPLPPYPLVWLNEVLSVNTTGLTDNQGDREPWIELFNSSDAPISLEGFYLTDDYLNLDKWAFPATAVINPGQFKVVFGDGEAGESTQDEWHTSFRVATGTGSIALTRFANGIPQIVDYLNFDNLLANFSYGAFPDGQLFDRREFFYPSPGASNNAAAPPLVVYINEWMAANTGFILDPADNDADDWFELYNPNPYTVDLGGAFLTDNLTNVAQFYRIPNNGHYTIAPLGYLLVWADGETQQNSTNNPDLHVDFSLRQAGEEIGLFASDLTLIDSVTFGRQTNNVSQGHYPAGTGPVYFMATPTPRGPNADPNPSTPPEILNIRTVNDTHVEFVVSTIPGRSYQVAYKQDLNEANWTPLGSAQPATGATLTFQHAITGTQGFYTVTLLP